MPPRKTGGYGYGVLGLLWMPWKVTGTILFYPAQLFMYMIVDVLGAEVIVKEKKVDESGKVTITEARQNKYPSLVGVTSKDKEKGFDFLKELVKYVKEFRYVLYDHFKWEKVKSPPWRCKGCSPGKAEYWCVEEGKKYCAQCAYNFHPPGSYAAVLSMEKITPQFNTHCHFLTPILPELMMVALVFYCARSSVLTQDYLTTQSTCPMTNRVRTMAGNIDGTLYYYWKQSFSQWCDMEDSYLRFLLDTWVRGVVTETDNTLLVFQTLVQAFLFNIVLSYALVPLLSVAYAIILNFFYTLECLLPRNIVFEKLEVLADMLDCTSGIISGSHTLPPETERRMRPSMDLMDWYKYEKQRKLKHLNYYYLTCVMFLTAISERILMAALVVRLGCCWFQLWPLLRSVCEVIPGVAGIIAKHEGWYSKAAGMLVDEAFIRQITSKGIAMTGTFTARVPTIVKRMCGAWVTIFVISVIAWGLFCHWMVRMRRAFWAKGGPVKFLEFGQDKVLTKRQA
mmetsp:Transcript_40739/g.93755  ORF Transcript_40739/g.93755 Transcript_40739/m.93755 type:complete len:509 (-) Transcript_40739:159-1685(-)